MRTPQSLNSWFLFFPSSRNGSLDVWYIRMVRKSVVEVFCIIFWLKLCYILSLLSIYFGLYLGMSYISCLSITTFSPIIKISTKIILNLFKIFVFIYWKKIKITFILQNIKSFFDFILKVKKKKIKYHFQYF